MKENIAATKAYYDKRFGELSQHLNEEETIRWKAIASVLKEQHRGGALRVADFGCGRGWLSHKLSDFGRVSGFDVSEKAIENARQCFPGLDFICLDASEAIPEEFAGTFDLVVSSEVIEHIQDQLSYLKNIFTLLRPGGHFLISTPNGAWFDAFYRDGRESWKQPVENWLSLPELSKLLKQAGLSTTCATTFNAEWVFDMRPPLRVKFLSHPLSRKVLKATGLYTLVLKKLNARGYGINGLVYGYKHAS